MPRPPRTSRSTLAARRSPAALLLALGFAACGGSASGCATAESAAFAGPSGVALAARDSVRTDSTTTGGADFLRGVAGVHIAATRLSLSRGDTVRLSAVATDTAGQALDSVATRWESSAPEVASVDSTGLVTALGQGAAQIGVEADSSRSAVLVVVSLPAPAPQGGEAPAEPELPREEVALPRAGVRAKRQIRVTSAAALQAAINSACDGDEILLPAGATFTGTFTLPPRDTAAGWVTIRTDVQLPAPDVRMTPELAESLRLARLVTRVAAPALQTAPRAAGWRILGVEITAEPTLKLMNALVLLGEAGNQKTLEAVPERLVLDRVYVHGHPELSARRCVTLNSARTAVVASTVSDCHYKGADSQALVGWNGPGPFLIENNRLEGAGEIIMFGGADAAIPNLIPSDIIVRGNHFTRPLSWKGVWTVKNLFELKTGRRVLVEGNLFENHWADAQSGAAILMKSVNQDGTNPWTQTSDVTFRYNVVRNTPAGFNLAGRAGDHPSVSMARVRLSHNYLLNVGIFHGTESGRALQLIGGVEDLLIDHNTIVHNANVGTAISFDGGPVVRGAIRDNVLTNGQYGVKGTGRAAGTVTLSQFLPGGDFVGNVVVGAEAGAYPAGNFFPPSLARAGLGALGAALAQGAQDDALEALLVAQDFQGKASDGSDPGADRSVAGLATRALRGGRAPSSIGRP
jgi:hypothetical protein